MSVRVGQRVGGGVVGARQGSARLAVAAVVRTERVRVVSSGGMVPSQRVVARGVADIVPVGVVADERRRRGATVSVVGGRGVVVVSGPDGVGS